MSDDRPARAAAGRLGSIGLAATGVSFALTLVVAVLGPSIMEPALPGRPGQPPWALAGHPSPYLAVALAAGAILTGIAGLTMCLNGMRRGWRVRPAVLLLAGITGAVVLAFLPPFGSSDHLSYAAYGRMVITGHNPYTTTPAELARLGDPVARAVQDWKNSPSVYGSLAVGLQALAARIGGDSVRLTVFLLSLLDVLAFAVTGLLLHWLGRGDATRQLRAALLWTANPLLLTVLVAGAHVDSQAIVFGVGAVAVAARALQAAQTAGSLRRPALLAAAAGALIGLGFAIKVTTALIGAGLAVGFLLTTRRQDGQQEPAVPGRPSRWPAAVIGGLATGFGAIAVAAVVPWGTVMFAPALRAGSYTSIGSPWRAVRSVLELALSDNVAEDLVKIGAVALAAGLLVLLLRYFSATSGQLVTACAFAVVLAWLLAWPYVLPWYDGLGWALIALLPASRLDWLLVARTGALAVGYLPARGVVLPAGLTWLETVVRTAITPAVLAVVIVTAAIWLWPGRTQLAVVR
jgi:hypothetical protein